MFELLALIIAIVAGIGGFQFARRFVRTRLRFVDGVQNASAPWIAGVATGLAAAPLVALLPVIGGGTALALAVGVGTGVARGAKDVRLASYHLDWPSSGS